MSPHIGQMFAARVVDKASREEVARTVVETITAPSFEVVFEGLVEGESYWVDLYADFNNNETYDAPPADHAWRLEADSVADAVVLSFQHSVNFTDIEWEEGALSVETQFWGQIKALLTE